MCSKRLSLPDKENRAVETSGPRACARARPIMAKQTHVSSAKLRIYGRKEERKREEVGGGAS